MTGNILIIEDESSIADNISYALENEGFTPHWVETAGDGENALESLNLDLIILDIGLPDMNGFELCKKIRRDSSIPIIFLTARSEEIDRIVGLEIGGDDYVTKPFSPREVAARVKAILRRQKDINCPAETESVSTNHNLPFVINNEKFEILFFGESLKLSRYEYKLLKTLIEHPGRIYSRRQLMERIWEEPETSMERTIDTHIKTIRSKMKLIKDIDVILTHRGFGYSLNDSIESLNKG